MSDAEESHEALRGSNAVEKDPWGHEHGEGERGESVTLHHPRRPDTDAHLISEPVKVTSDHRRPLIAVLLTAALAAAAITAVVAMDWI